jgi:hypothetical protein
MADIQLKDLPVLLTALDEAVMHTQDGGVDKQITKVNFLKENTAELERLAGIQITQGNDISTNQGGIATNVANITANSDALALTDNAVALNTAGLLTKLNTANGVAYDSARLGNVLASSYGLKGTYGSNANGSWVIDGEGNLTQFGQVGIPSGTTTSINFPMSFVGATPYLVASQITSGPTEFLYTFSQNLNGFTAAAISAALGTLAAAEVSYIAYGRAF